MILRQGEEEAAWWPPLFLGGGGWLEKQIPRGNDRKKSKTKNQYRGLSASVEMAGLVVGEADSRRE